MTKHLLISSSRIKRAHLPAFRHDNFTLKQLQVGKGMLVVEPTFKEFAGATQAQLEAPIRIAQLLQPDDTDGRIAVMISYSRKNARTFKGWVNDVVAAYKARGFEQLVSLHVPFESYGVPMVGSTLLMLLGRDRIAFEPEQRAVMPAQQWPTMVYHAVSGRVRGSVYAGLADLNGFLNSEKAFLPDLSMWDEQGLRVEYRDGQTTRPATLGDQQLGELFGAGSWQSLKDLHLCTPAALLQQIVERTRLLT